jgi:hypothetical protein
MERYFPSLERSRVSVAVSCSDMRAKGYQCSGTMISGMAMERKIPISDTRCRATRTR